MVDPPVERKSMFCFPLCTHRSADASVEASEACKQRDGSSTTCSFSFECDQRGPSRDELRIVLKCHIHSCKL
eukprot:6490632-Amphidinium_carterae.3